MGPVLAHCTDRVQGMGDSTAGPVWRESLRPSQPLLGGYEQSTNYPVGESLYSPVGYASLAETSLMTVLAKISGPVCSYNLSNAIGYLATSIIMFAFVWYITKNRWIALLAGYAVAFTPYIQSKIGGHPSYAHGWLLIAAAWLFLHTVHTRKKRYAALLAGVLAICAYFDPYFILLSGTVLAPLFAVWCMYVGYRAYRQVAYRAKAIAVLKLFLVTAGVFLVLVSPLAIVRIKDASKIESTVASARGNVFAAALLCSNLPLDYLLPDPFNVHFIDIFGPKFSLKDISMRHWCGIGESRVSISLIMISVVMITLIIVVWEKLNRRRLRLGKLFAYDPVVLIGGICLVGVAALLIGMPPLIGGVRMPSYLILKVTPTWRIFAREYLVVNIATVLLFACCLKFFSAVDFVRRRRWIGVAALVGLFLLVMAEYQVTAPFSPPQFSYSTDIPSVYFEIKQDPNIHAIAEYPIDRIGVEYDSIVYYLTMQTVHGKSLFNSAIPNDRYLSIHTALKDLNDPQTIPALRALGIQYVVIHGLAKEDILAATDQLTIVSDTKPPVYSLKLFRPGDTDDVILAKINDGPKLYDVLTIEKGYTPNLEIIQSALEAASEVTQNAELEVTPLPVRTLPVYNAASPVCFGVRMAAGNGSLLTVSVNGAPQVVSPITATYTEITVMAKRGDHVQLSSSAGGDLQLNNFGCSQ